MLIPSLNCAAPSIYDFGSAEDDEDVLEAAPSSPKGVARTKRGHGHHLPTWMNTYAMTDHHGHFKWGVRHNIKHR